AGLFVRLRKLESQQEKADTRIENVEDREGISELKKEVKAVNAELKKLHLCLLENYIRREDWIPTASKILGSLEKQRELLARHDERLKHYTGADKK
ncbi:MAG: hypothetical protein OXI10_03980, partial [Gammaproteobacteria bacterium]|nr:hypothetical protein [Gammaproteobacteria bacterium]